MHSPSFDSATTNERKDHKLRQPLDDTTLLHLTGMYFQWATATKFAKTRNPRVSRTNLYQATEEDQRRL